MPSTLTAPPSPIDVVITWVDGNDPALTEKRNRYLRSEGKSPADAGALPTRFAANNEVRYCVLSILKFAPFVRRIFIVTDGQDPNLHEEVKTYFPERAEPYVIVDHKDIFVGLERYLPTFNANSINSLIWRIEGLSENFVYFNDDVFLINPVQPADWVVHQRPVLRGRWQAPPYRKMLSDRLTRGVRNIFVGKPRHQPRVSYYVSQWNAASMLGFQFRYFFHCHTPHVMSRKLLGTFFASNPKVLEANVASRFLVQDQYIVTALSNHLELLSGNRNLAPLNLGYLHPYYPKERIVRRLKRCEGDPRVKSICAQSLDMLGQEMQDAIYGFMDRRLALPPRPTH